MRRNLLNWSDLVSISKKSMFYVFGGSKNLIIISGFVAKKIVMKNSKLKFGE